MKQRWRYALALCTLSAMIVLGQSASLEGTWVTDGVPAVEAAKKAGKTYSSLAEATRIKLKADAKKGKVSGTISQLNTDKEFDIADGKLTDKTFTFKSVEIVTQQLGFGGRNQDFGGGNSNTAAPAPISWKGELTDADTVTLTRVNAAGESVGMPLVLHRAKK